MAESKTPLMVLALGNLLCMDDGAGIRALRYLEERYEPAPGVLLLDGGTLGLSLLPYLETAERAILVDAVAAPAAAGSLVRLSGADVCRAATERLSCHQIGVADLLDGARLLDRLPPELVLIGVVPSTVGLGLELSPAVEASIADLAAWVVEEAAAQGHPFRAREVRRSA